MDARQEMHELEWLRNDIIGRNAPIQTPFGTKPLVYADHTASGRALQSFENYLQDLLQYYANSHTEDDLTGETMTKFLHQAEALIKRAVNAGPSGKIIFAGNGATGAITRLQQILGVYWPPATKARIEGFLEGCADGRDQCTTKMDQEQARRRPLVLVGPYEHHSNEISWREGYCDVREIPLGNDGTVDLEVLEKVLSDPMNDGREIIGSFSAASNVSGRKTSIYDVARLLHDHQALAIFDFAAAAPYVEIDMNKDAESWFDAIVLSPHKFLGGPGSAGLLVFNERIYRKDLPPSVAGGGTVDYVGFDDELYTEDIEAREKPGTPGILQGIKAALAFGLKEKVGIDRIEAIESYLIREFWSKLGDRKEFVFYSTQDPQRNVSIIAFNIRHQDVVFHPKFITRLLNDVFGIQTRAGCSCAGPYGHNLLGIDGELSRQYSCLIGQEKLSGFKPGWVRLNLHWSFSQEEFNYITDALVWVAENAERFLPLYRFHPTTGEWRYDSSTCIPIRDLSIEEALSAQIPRMKRMEDLRSAFEVATSEAKRVSERCPKTLHWATFSGESAQLAWFRAVLVENPRELAHT